MSRNLVDRYFALSLEIEEAKKVRDYPRAIRAARASYPLLAALVEDSKRSFGRFDIGMSHAVHTAPTLMAVLGEAEGLRELRAALQATPELHEWLPAADEADEDLRLVPRILGAVAAAPGLRQNTLKQTLAIDDGRRLSTLAGWLEKAGRLVRVKEGSQYALYPAGHTFTARAAAGPAAIKPEATTLPAAPPSPPSDWRGRTAQRAQPLDLSQLPIIRLPKAPLRWETGSAAQRSSAKSKDQPPFLVDGAGWTLGRVDRLAPAERPDPAFKQSFPAAARTFWLDPKGRRAGFEQAAAVLQVVDAQGQARREIGLGHDVYRADLNADGTGILFLSREGTLHGYTETLEPCLMARLADLPEYQAQARRLGIAPTELKNHTRCVALSTDRSHFLVTVVDEAWCLDAATGRVRWGVRTPLQEGWTRRVHARTERTGTGTEVHAALTLMQLRLPVTPDDITRQYRALAKQWHPDRNPGDPSATRRFQDLASAVELLTGTDLSRLTGAEAEQVTYERILSTQRITVPDGQGGTIGLSISLGGSEKSAADWIYAANLGRDGRAFLATYAGKVVILSPTGTPSIVYDIGAVPRHIVDASGRLYILTDTRLYVLTGERLDAFLDVAEAGDLLVADRGFALLTAKTLTWCTPEGEPIGRVEAQDPIRRVRSTPDGLVVETRQARAVVLGAPPWWA